MADNFDKAVDLAARLRESADSKDNEGAEGLIRGGKRGCRNAGESGVHHPWRHAQR